jgi:predicted HicB family RNase H-like nuclease
MMSSHRYAGTRRMAEAKERRDAPLSVRVRASLKRDLSQLAAADRRSLALYVEMALEEHVAAKKAEGKPAGKRK